MHAIILAGGLGTRVQELTKNKIPKPMLCINERPLLEYIVDWLLMQDMKEIIFAIGFKGDVVRQHFKNNYKGIKIQYSDEGDYLLGTGGAIKKALAYCSENTVFVINGDTYFPVDLKKFLSCHKRNYSEITLALKHLYNFYRFGTVEIDAGTRIRSFKEKGFYQEGFINAGIYCIKKDILLNYTKDTFSFEKEILEKQIKELRIFGKIFDGIFHDIGTPADYKNFSEVTNYV
ncbi:D-glycero-alpha-D-manno-heptose 1-phosphate guanylyltransferase [Patescibacteria group bacterium]|nr:D-glycero-alpha-D-manno-heptose 1-phosphate guanylyltransferase [Patescibacteria group bacterium]